MSTIWENPAVKWVANVAQVLFITFICWLGSNIGSSVTAFSTKLDDVLSSIAKIAAAQAMQERDMRAFDQRLIRGEGKIESLEQRVTRMSFQVEQMEKEKTHGR
ncbi:hypothetical protein HZF02_32910 (plasmid) [Pseudomonas yamanorum]|nr:hypothetical protein HZF02_32910 [Pseudomonas yamanorum]